MFTSFQLIGLIIFLAVFLYTIIDRICKCIELTKNPMNTAINFAKFVETLKNEDGNKSV